MVQVVNKNMIKTCKVSVVKNLKVTKTNMKKKQEIKSLYNKLNAVLPSFDDQDHVCGADVVFKAVQYINLLHRRVTNERGVEALQQIQNNASKIALQQLMAMKAHKSCEVSINTFL